jgi:hypothetical protein
MPWYISWFLFLFHIFTFGLIEFPLLKPKQIWYEKPIYYMGNHLNIFTDEENIPYPVYTDL